MKRFDRRIAVDIRDSQDWEPYLAPKAPEGAPKLLFIAWDGTLDKVVADVSGEHEIDHET